MPRVPPRKVKNVMEAKGDAFAAAGDVIFQLLRPDDKEPVTPHALLRKVPSFTGREPELARIIRLAASDSVVTIAVDGVAGIGKTALALQAAHLLTSASGADPPPFPGGHLYKDLGGFDIAGQPPAEPGEVLGEFLRQLGMSEGELPPGTAERSARFRNRVASRRTLLVLDNAAHADQVKPLLPGEGASLVIITSRPVIEGLAVDDHIHLGMLPGADARALMTSLIGAPRASAQPDKLADVVDSCGALPLALWIAGEWLAASQERSVGQLAERLTDERSRLDRLAAGDQQVRAAFEVSYRQLRKGDKRMFRLLGLHPGPHFDIEAAARIADFRDEAAAAAALDRLAKAHLITEERLITAEGKEDRRYRFLDLLRLFARETCEAHDDDEDRTRACERVVGHFSLLAWFLYSCLDPRERLRHAEDAQDEMLLSQRGALTQFAAERPNLMAVVRLAAEQGWHETVWRMSDHMGGALTLSRHLDDLLEVRTAALAAARQAQDSAACGRALANLGHAYVDLRRFGEAVSCFEEELAICEGLAGEGMARGNLGLVYSELRQFDKAIAYFQRALDLCRAAGEQHGTGQLLGNLGNAYQESGQLDRAIEAYLDALRVSWDTKDRRGEGEILNNLGIICLRQRRFAKAIDCFEDDRAICRRLGDQYGEALSIGNLGNIYYERGQFDDAIARYQDALTICRKIGDRHNEGQALGNLAIASHRRGQREEAVSYLLDAARAMRESGDPEAAARYEGAASTALSAGLSRPRWWHRPARLPRAAGYWEGTVPVLDSSQRTGSSTRCGRTPPAATAEFAWSGSAPRADTPK